MAPPETPGIPGLQLPPERRPAPVNAPPHVAPEVDAQPAGQVTFARGRWALSMPSVVALALIASVGGFATAWANKPNAGDPAEIVAGLRLEIAKQKTEQDATLHALLDQVQSLQTQVVLMRISQDALRDRLNAIK